MHVPLGKKLPEAGVEGPQVGGVVGDVDDAPETLRGGFHGEMELREGAQVHVESLGGGSSCVSTTAKPRGSVQGQTKLSGAGRAVRWLGWSDRSKNLYELLCRWGGH